MAGDNPGLETQLTDTQPARGVGAGSHSRLMGITYGCVYCSNKESLSLALAQDLCLGKRLSLNRPIGAFVYVGESYVPKANLKFYPFVPSVRRTHTTPPPSLD